MSGNWPRSSRMNPGPADEAGKSLMAAAPARHAVRISVGVAHPGSAGMPCEAAQATRSVSRWGITRKVAPASMARLAASIDSTVPAPISNASPALSFAMASIAASALVSGLFRVSSKARTPPAASASATPGAAVAETRRPMATTPPTVMPTGIWGRVFVAPGATERRLVPLRVTASLDRDGTPIAAA